MRAAAAVIVLLLLPGVLCGQVREVDRGLARVYFDQAQSVARAQSVTHAQSLLSTALEHWPEYADALYLRARLRRNDAASTREVIRDLEAAIAAGTFEEYPPEAAVAALAQIYIRTREFASALELISTARSFDPELSRSLQADLLYLEAYALEASGMNQRASDRVSVGMSRFPDDPRFLSLRITQDAVSDLRHRQLIERLVPGAPDEAYLDLLLAYARAAPTATERSWAIGRYLADGGSDPALLIPLATSGVEPQRFVSLLEEVLLASTPLDLGIASELAALLTDGDLLSAAPIEQALSRYTGSAIVDADRDGFAEQRFDARMGSVTRWQIDRDQDGDPEVDLEISDRRPQSVALGDRFDAATIYYESYPRVDRVVWEQEDRSETLFVIPARYQFRALEQLVDPASAAPELLRQWMIAEPIPTVAYERVSSVSYSALIEYAAGGYVRAWLDSGRVFRDLRDRDGDGYVEELRVYDSSGAYDAVRDVDADGYFEVYESRSASGAIARVIDENDDRVPELLERVDESELLEWDTNGDGAIDVREFRVLKQQILFDFPTLDEVQG